MADRRRAGPGDGRARGPHPAGPDDPALPRAVRAVPGDRRAGRRALVGAARPAGLGAGHGDGRRDRHRGGPVAARCSSLGGCRIAARAWATTWRRPGRCAGRTWRRSCCRTCSACRTAAGSPSGSSGRRTCTSGSCRSGWRWSGRCSPRRRVVPFFLLLTVFALMVGLADQSPVNIHRLLWNLPGFSSLRAPGRYAYLIVFGVAGAGGVRARSAGAAGAAIVAGGWRGAPGRVGSAAVDLPDRRAAPAPAGRSGPLADADRPVLPVASTTSTTGSTGDLVYGALVDGLNLTDPKTLLSVALLVVDAAAAAGLGAPASLARRPGRVAGGRTGGRRPAGVRLRLPPARADHSLLEPAPVTRFLVDARAGCAGLRGLVARSSWSRTGCSTPTSRPSPGIARSGRSATSSTGRPSTSQEDALLDWWSVRQVVMADPPRDVVIVDGTAYRPYNALFRGTAVNRRRGDVRRPSHSRGPPSSSGVLSTLIDGVQAEQDTPVAEVTLVGTDGSRRAFQLLAGVHTAENAYDRPDVRAASAPHPRRRWLAKIPDIDPSGLPAQTNVYLGDVPRRLDWTLPRSRFGSCTRSDTRGCSGSGWWTRPARSARSSARIEPSFTRSGAQDGIAVLPERPGVPRAYVVPEGIRSDPERRLGAGAADLPAVRRRAPGDA